MTFLDLVKISSLSLREKRVAEYAAECLKSLGLKVTVDSAGDSIGGESGNIIAYLPANQDRGIPILLNAHMDTVNPGEGIVPIIEVNSIKSNGDTILGADDKAGMSVIIEVLRSIREDNLKHGDIEVIFTVAEEIGLLGSKNLDLSKLKARYAFVFDGEGDTGRIVTRAPSQNSIKAKFIGKAAHAGLNPEEGVNAIVAASDAISAMNLGRIDSETTANVGVIKGGIAPNIVPPDAYFEGEARSLSEEKLKRQTEHMEKCLKDSSLKAGTQVEIEISRVYSSFNLKSSDKVLKIAVEAAKRLNIETEFVSSGGGSDTNIFNESGIPAVNLSLGYRNVHTTDEHIQISDLTKAAKHLQEIVRVAAEG